MAIWRAPALRNSSAASAGDTPPAGGASNVRAATYAALRWLRSQLKRMLEIAGTKIMTCAISTKQAMSAMSRPARPTRSPSARH